MNTWVAAAIAVAAGVVVGQLAGRIVRRVLSHDRQPAAIREVAGSIGGFVFALCLTAGLVTAVGIIDPSQLETMPRGLVNYLPKLIVAGIMVLLGNVAASVLGMVVGRSLQQASGEERPTVVRAVKGVVVGAAVILAVGQLGGRHHDREPGRGRRCSSAPG